MKNLYCFLSLLLISLLSMSGFSKASVPEGINLTKTSNGYIIDFKLPSYQFLPIAAEGEDYNQLLITGYGVKPEVGLPALPIVSFNLFIAYEETQPEFELKNIITSEMILKNKIFPFQMPWEKSSPIEDRPFTINNEYYNSNGNIEQPFVKISEPFIIAGVKGVTVTFYPFRYNPVENRLIAVNSGSINILLNRPIVPVMHKSISFDQF